MTTNKLRFGDMVYAVECTPKALRNWLQREQVELASATTPAGGWREFELADVPHLALVRSMADFGIEIRQADEIAKSLGDAWEIWRIDAKGDFIVADHEAALYIQDGQLLCHPFDGRFEAESAISHAPATLVLRVGRIVARAMQRALERTDSKVGIA